jgi:hypothetical protein
MAITYKLLEDGAFVAGDTDSRLTSYAYPTSIHATKAKRRPGKVAAAMIAGEEAAITATRNIRSDYDERNWQRLA